jgi:hypothetical protein
MVPPLPLPLSFGGEDGACSMHANNSPTVLVHAVCWTLKARTLLDRHFQAGPVSSNDSKGNGGNNNSDTGSGSQELDCAPDWDGPLLSPPSGCAMWTRVSGK